MWFKQVDFKTLISGQRWNVEYFAEPEIEFIDSGYNQVSLGEIVRERKTGINPQEYPTKQFNYLGLENIRSHTGELVDFSKKCGAEILSRSKIFESNDILYGRLRPALNKVYLAQGEVSHGICSGEFYVLTPLTDRIYPRVLRHLIASDIVLGSLLRYQSGAALPRIPLNDLLQIRVPVPPLKHQEELELFLAKSEDQLRALRFQVVELPRTMKQQLMRVFSGVPSSV